MNSKIRTVLESGVLTITLADEEKRNALSYALASEFLEAMDSAENDPHVRVVVVTNEGSTFCAGADLSERSTDNTSTIDPMEIFGRIRTSQKPYVGRIDGHAIAGGLGLAASMDISVGVKGTKYGFSEVRLGLAPAIISVICLPKMRHGEAAEAFLRGNRFDADESARLGLISRCVERSDLDSEIERIVADLLEGGPNALGESKRLLREVPGRDFEDALRWASSLSADLFDSDEGREGMRAFLEKRPPKWSPESDA